MSIVTDARVLRGAAAAMALGRVGIGAATLVDPGPTVRLWLGSATSPAAGALGRALGARDLALGVGALGALAAPRRGAWPWVLAGGAADAADAAATVLAWEHVSRRGRWLVTAAAGGAAVTSTALCCGLVAARDR